MDYSEGLLASLILHCFVVTLALAPPPTHITAHKLHPQAYYSSQAPPPGILQLTSSTPTHITAHKLHPHTYYSSQAPPPGILQLTSSTPCTDVVYEQYNMSIRDSHWTKLQPHVIKDMYRTTRILTPSLSLCVSGYTL